jgi:hypothetical protein
MSQDPSDLKVGKSRPITKLDPHRCVKLVAEIWKFRINYEIK